MKRALFIGLILAAAIGLEAQQAPPPDILTPNTAASTANTNAWLWLTGQISNLWTAVTQQQSLTQNLTGDEAKIVDLQTRVTNLEAAVAALQNPSPAPPPQPTTVSFTNVAAGPLSGIVNGVQLNTGMWQGTPQGIQPAVTGVGRTFVLPVNRIMTQVSFECMTVACTVTFTDGSGETVTGNDPTPGNLVVLNTGWAHQAGAVNVSVSAPGSNALDLRIAQLIYQ